MNMLKWSWVRFRNLDGYCIQCLNPKHFKLSIERHRDENYLFVMTESVERIQTEAVLKLTSMDITLIWLRYR